MRTNFERLVLCGIFLVALLWTAVGAGAIVIALDHEAVFPGETARVGVYASSNTADIITGFNFPLDIGGSIVGNAGDGRALLPAGFTLNPLPVQDFLYPNTQYAASPSAVPANVDAIPWGTGDNVTLSVAPLRLFDLVIDVASDATPGTVLPIRIIIPGNALQSLFNIDGPDSNNPPLVLSPSIGVPALGSISVVPEPGAFYLLLLVSLASGAVMACSRMKLLVRGSDRFARAIA